MDGALQLWQLLVSTPDSLAHLEGRVLKTAGTHGFGTYSNGGADDGISA